MSLDALPDGWEVWSDEATRVVLVYRPDVFDSAAFPAPCLPTIYLTKGERDRRPGPNDPAPDDPWYVTLYLEPDVNRSADPVETRREAIATARDLARRFAGGDLDLRSFYQVPRGEYLDRLDDLVG